MKKLMTYFNQKGQHTTNQYNIAGDVYLGQSIHINKFISQLNSLSDNITELADKGNIDKTTRVEVDQLLNEIKQEAVKPQPNKNKVTDLLKKIEQLLKGVTAAGGIVDGIKKIITYFLI